jgi:integrase
LDRLGRDWALPQPLELSPQLLQHLRDRGIDRQRRLSAWHADRWFEEGKTRRAWKPKTVLAFRSTLGHLKRHFGPLPLGAIRPPDVADYTRAALAGEILCWPDGSPRPASGKTVPAAPERPARHVQDRQGRGARRVEPGRGRRAAEDPAPALPDPRACGDPPSAAAPRRRAGADDLPRARVLTGLRRFELQALRWSDLDLLEGILRVRDSKSEEGVRSIALSPTLVEELSRHYQRTAFKGDDELVFCHTKRGSRIDHEWFAGEFRSALVKAGITDHVRPFHDLPHTAITNDAAAGASALAVMAKAGHQSMSTTKTYLHLAGVVFHEEANALERRLFGDSQAAESIEQAAGRSV